MVTKFYECSKHLNNTPHQMNKSSIWRMDVISKSNFIRHLHVFYMTQWGNKRLMKQVTSRNGDRHIESFGKRSIIEGCS